MTLSESHTSNATRIKADIENCYNLCMQIKMSQNESTQEELFKELKNKIEKVQKFINEFCP